MSAVSSDSGGSFYVSSSLASSSASPASSSTGASGKEEIIRKLIFENKESVMAAKRPLEGDAVKISLTPEQKERIQRILNQSKEGIIEQVVGDESKERIARMVEDIWSKVEKIKDYGNELELKIGVKGHSFKILFDPAQEGRIRLVFHHSLVAGLGAGAYKTVTRALDLSETGSEELIATKERVGQKKDIQVVGSKEYRAAVITGREQSALKRCCERKLIGTPKTFVVSYYVGKNKVVKQRIMQKLYLGGDLEKASIPSSQKLRIACEICRIVANFHNIGNMSHNDIKPENFVLDIVCYDKNLKPIYNPILIDFGGTTLDDSNEFGILTHQYLAPEFFDSNLLKEKEKLQEKIVSLNARLPQLSDEKESLIEGLLQHNPELQQLLDSDEILKQLRESGSYQFKIDQQKIDILSRGKENLPPLAGKINEVLERVNKIDSEVDDIIGGLYETEERLEDLEGELISSIDVSQGIPYKNDNFALGMVLSYLYQKEAPPEVKDTIQALLEADPEKRMTAEKAFARLNELFDQK